MASAVCSACETFGKIWKWFWNWRKGFRPCRDTRDHENMPCESFEPVWLRHRAAPQGLPPFPVPSGRQSRFLRFVAGDLIFGIARQGTGLDWYILSLWLRHRVAPQGPPPFPVPSGRQSRFLRFVAGDLIFGIARQGTGLYTDIYKGLCFCSFGMRWWQKEFILFSGKLWNERKTFEWKTATSGVQSLLQGLQVIWRRCYYVSGTSGKLL